MSDKKDKEHDKIHDTDEPEKLDHPKPQPTGVTPGPGKEPPPPGDDDQQGG